MDLLAAWLLSALSIIITAFILPGIETGILPAFLAAAVLGLVNAFIKPILLALALPINILTLGLFTLVINAFLIMLVGWVVPGFRVKGFWRAVLFAIVYFVIHSILQWIF